MTSEMMAMMGGGIGLAIGFLLSMFCQWLWERKNR